MIAQGALNDAFSAASNAGGDAKNITAILPAIIAGGNTDDATNLIKLYKNGASWLPEALTLLNTNGLNINQKRAMLSAIFDGAEFLTDTQAQDLSAAAARIGSLGFSFPQWRFLSQGMGGPSLLEQYGMARLARATDVRDESLPKSDPARDRFGTGFFMQDIEWKIEYRRAYILCARTGAEQVTLIIRNSSYFFGRDRLNEAAYVSFDNLSKAYLQNIDEHSFGPNGPFLPLTAMLVTSADIKINRVQAAIDRFDTEDMRLSRWLFTDGAPHLQAFIQSAQNRQAQQGKTAPPFYIALHDPALPPWFPQKTQAASLESVNSFKSVQGRLKAVLLSSPDGDFPVKPASLRAATKDQSPPAP